MGRPWPGSRGRGEARAPGYPAGAPLPERGDAARPEPEPANKVVEGLDRAFYVMDIDGTGSTTSRGRADQDQDS
jgi:hypothetical protein